MERKTPIDQVLGKVLPKLPTEGLGGGMVFVGTVTCKLGVWSGDGDGDTVSGMTGAMVLIRCEYVTPSGFRCDRETLDHSDRWCAIHCPADELDLSSFHAARARAAKYTLARGLPTAAEALVRIAGDPTEGSGAVIKASTEILDRAGIPRVAATVLQADITHREGKTAGQIVAERLAGLAGRLAEDAEDDLPEPPGMVVDGTVSPVPASETVAERLDGHGEGDPSTEAALTV